MQTDEEYLEKQKEHELSLRVLDTLEITQQIIERQNIKAKIQAANTKVEEITKCFDEFVRFAEEVRQKSNIPNEMYLYPIVLGSVKSNFTGLDTKIAEAMKLLTELVTATPTNIEEAKKLAAKSATH